MDEFCLEFYKLLHQKDEDCKIFKINHSIREYFIWNTSNNRESAIAASVFRKCNYPFWHGFKWILIHITFWKYIDFCCFIKFFHLKEIEVALWRGVAFVYEISWSLMVCHDSAVSQKCILLSIFCLCIDFFSCCRNGIHQG